MLSATELFVRRYDELFDGLNARDAFETLKLGAVLRQLLTDTPALLHQANREYKLKIIFTVNDVGDLSDIPVKPDIVFHSLGLDPSFITMSKGTLNLNLDNFLKQKVIQTPNLSITIKHIIRFSANKYGGVHFDSVRSGEEKEIDNIFNQLRIIGIEPVANALKVISKIVLVALKPLWDAIVKLPDTIPLFAHYRLERGQSMMFAGEGQFMETNNLSYQVKEGFSWNWILKIISQKNESDCYIYDIGNQNENFPRFSLIFSSNTNLVAKAEFSSNLILKAEAREFSKSIFFDRFCFVSMQICCKESQLTLELRINNEFVNSVKADLTGSELMVTKHTIGADMSGENSAAFHMRELVISERCLNAKELNKLGGYFWMRWHD